MFFPDQNWLLTPAQTQSADRAYVAAGGDSWQLMRNAAGVVTGYILNTLPCRPLHVLCGPGNNGADGLVVAAMLREIGWPVSVSRLAALPSSGDGEKAVALWGDEVPLADPQNPGAATYYLDALFGAGLNRDLDGAAATLVRAINDSGRTVISIDMPSGIDGADGAIRGAAIRAHHTVSFFRAKPGHWLMPGRDACGQLHIGQIGLTPIHVSETIRTALNDPLIWREALPGLDVRHKYERGRLWIAGGAEMTGAASLAASAAMRAGAGLVGIAAPTKAADIYRGRERALVVSEADSLDRFASLLVEKKPDAIVIGPGLGLDADSKDKVGVVLGHGVPAVIDADALTGFADDPDALFWQLSAHHVLTPHEGEFARLFPDLTGSRIDRARDAAERAGAIIILKGRDTVIAQPDRSVLINNNAPTSLAVAGSGDVLAGIIGALLARGMSADKAAPAAVWLHGAAGKLAENGAIADDLPGCVGRVLARL